MAGDLHGAPLALVQAGDSGARPALVLHDGAGPASLAPLAPLAATHHVLASDAGLLERDVAKQARWAAALQEAMEARWVGPAQAALAAAVASAVFGVAYAAWLGETDGPGLTTRLDGVIEGVSHLQGPALVVPWVGQPASVTSARSAVTGSGPSGDGADPPPG